MLPRIFSLKFLLWTAAVLTALVLIFIAEENWRGRRAWENYRTAAEKRGVKLFLKDFIQPDIADSENYAAIPLVRDMFAKKANDESRSDPLALPRKGQPKGVDLFGDRTSNLDAWQAFFVENELVEGKSGDPARDVLRGLEKFEPALQQLRDASARPRCKFPTRWEDGFGTALPHMSPLMSAARLFTLRMDAHLALGDVQAARGELHHLLRLHDALGTEPSLIGRLVRVSLLGNMATAVRKGLAARQWTEADLLAIERDLGSLHPLDDYRFAVSTERGTINLELQRITAARMHERTLLLSSASSLNSTPDGYWLMAIYPKGWIFQNMVRANEYFDTALAPYGKSTPTNHVAFVPEGESAEHWLESIGALSGPKRFYYIFLNFLLPVLDSAQRKFLIAHTQLQQIQLGCALERFRKEQGNFPAKLEELVPQFIPAMPIDVFDATALRYRRHDDGSYDIWSIGSNRKDDGGKIEQGKTLQDQPDWLWRMPGSPKAP